MNDLHIQHKIEIDQIDKRIYRVIAHKPHFQRAKKSSYLE